MWNIKESVIEKAVLIGLDTPSAEIDAEESLSELYQLARTAGASVEGKFIQSRVRPHPASYLGKGKVEEVKDFVRSQNLNLVIVDDELTPTQEKNLEEELGCKVIDRTRLILDIFALHASSGVGKLQVELAQLEYYLPRLKNIWTEFSRLGGGIGTRGPGEKKIEIDRRIISDRIHLIKKKLLRVAVQRREQRSQRTKIFKKSVMLVGYTNSGKSTLMNNMTGTKIGVANKLFSTLSPTTRNLKFGKYEILLTDTVGFIRKLPHSVVEAFMATLEQIQEADMLLHVVDISSENYRTHINAVNKVLGSLNALNKPVIMVYNKIDKTEIEPGKRDIPNAVYISALHSSGIDALKEGMETELEKTVALVYLKIPQGRQDIINSVYKTGYVFERKYEGNDVVLKCQLDKELITRYKKYKIK